MLSSLSYARLYVYSMFHLCGFRIQVKGFFLLECGGAWIQCDYSHVQHKTVNHIYVTQELNCNVVAGQISLKIQ